MLVNVQTALSLQDRQYVDGHYSNVPTGITSTAVKRYSYTSYFKLQFLLITHLIVSLYVGVNAVIAATLMFASLFGISVLIQSSTSRPSCSSPMQAHGLSGSARISSRPTVCLLLTILHEARSCFSSWLPMHTSYFWRGAAAERAYRSTFETT